MKTTNCGIWIRVSTEYQVRDESPEHHLKRAELYAQAHDWNVVEIYRLDAVSGKTVMEHPETKRMLNDIKRGHITTLIFSKIARLARNTRELLEFADFFRSNKADLVSLAENIDTSSPAGRLFFTIISSMAQWEAEEIGMRVKASVPIRAKLGKPLGGASSYGYVWKDKEYHIDETEAPVRKLIYELFRKEKRKNTVARLLNEKGYRTRKGSMFSDTTIGRLLVDPSAKGQRRANYTRSLGEKKNWEIKDESEWVIVPCPAIISEELWDECNQILYEQEKLRKKPTKKAIHLFTGIVYCECNTKMYIPSLSKKYVCFKCRKNRILSEDLEDIYYENLKSFLLTDEHLESLLEKADEVITSKSSQLKLMENEKAKLEKEMDKLVQLHMSGEIPKDGFGKYYKPLEQQVQQIESTLPEIQAELDYLRIETLNSDQVARDAKNLYDRWPTLENEEKRNIIEQVTSKIIVSNNEIKITFSYTPVPSKIPIDDKRNLMGS